jgi:hypothetical protein
LRLRENVTIVRTSPGKTSFSAETSETIATKRAIIAPPSSVELELTATLGVRVTATVIFPAGTDVKTQDYLEVDGRRLRVVQVQQAIRKVIAFGEEAGYEP